MTISEKACLTLMLLGCVFTISTCCAGLTFGPNSRESVLKMLKVGYAMMLPSFAGLVAAAIFRMWAT